METINPASYVSSSNWLFSDRKGTKWTHEENKQFETALALFDKDTPDRWLNIAAMIPGKTAVDVMKQYQDLEDDVSDIEAGLYPSHGYSNSCNSLSLDWVKSHSGGFDGLRNLHGSCEKRSRHTDQDKKKGVPWTEEEHRQFLLGLQKYGKGDWRHISRNFVTTRTPTQVASHAQKYFIRQLSGTKEKRRSSIHDITTVNLPHTKPSSSDIKTPSPDHSNTRQQNTCGMTQSLFNLPNASTTMGFNTRNENSLPFFGSKLQEQYFHGSYKTMYQIQSAQNYRHKQEL